MLATRFLFVVCIALFLVIWFSQANAQGMVGGCGKPPQAPPGMYYMCICNNVGNNCQLVLISKK